MKIVARGAEIWQKSAAARRTARAYGPCTGRAGHSILHAIYSTLLLTGGDLAQIDHAASRRDTVCN